jgi:hypothetical protein
VNATPGPGVGATTRTALCASSAGAKKARTNGTAIEEGSETVGERMRTSASERSQD